MGWTKVIYKLEPDHIKHLFHVPGVKPDITFGERYDLSPLGLDAYVLHTPGHSSGSSCVIVENEIAIVGDTMGGFLPGTLFPPWGDDPEALLRSWKLLLDTGCHTFPSGSWICQKQKQVGERIPEKTMTMTINGIDEGR